MSQVIFDSIDPTISGETLAETLDDFKDAIVSGCSGTSRPTNLQAGGSWVDTTNNPTSWDFKVYTGSTDITIFTLNLVSGVGSVALAVDSFSVKKVSADAVGAILGLIKQRASGGQVLSGDVVGEIRVVGRTDSATNPVVAKIIYTATDDMTTSASGGTLSFMSTPDGSATLTEHFRFINGLFETVVPHKINSLILTSQNVATAATIAQLSGAKVVVEMTGATATDIQGVNSAHDSQVVTIHNRSSAVVTLKHLNGSAAAADQIKLPNSLDYSIPADGSATLYYCTTDTKWKLMSSSELATASATDKLFGVTQTWTSNSSTTTVRVRAFRSSPGVNTESNGMLDPFGNAYAWGVNANGQLGVGDVTPRSSPVAVLGGFQFIRKYGATAAATGAYAISINGSAYAWGINTNGQLGDGTVIPKSSPVAVLGSVKFNALFPRDASVHGIATNNAAFSWGLNTNGQLGDGSVIPKSSPVAVTGGLKFAKLVPISGANSAAAVAGLTTSGVAYAWGIATNGNLGDGTVVAKSNPTAVLRALTFADLAGGAVSSRYFFVGLDTTGAAYAWGANTQSNLGVGDQTPRSSPVAVLGGLTFSKLYVNPKSESVFALNSSGTAYAWGDNTKGVLGDGTIVNKSSPVAVLGSLAFTKLIPYKSSIFGLTSDGTAYAWGDNTNGQLGVGDVTARSSPVAVLGSLKFSDIAFVDGPTETYGVYGETTDGTLYSWGLNTNGGLGLGDVVPRSSPVAVLGAFGPDCRETVTTFDLPVVASTAYTVTLGTGYSSFGTTPIGRDIYKVEIEY